MVAHLPPFQNTRTAPGPIGLYVLSSASKQTSLQQLATVNVTSLKQICRIMALNYLQRIDAARSSNKRKKEKKLWRATNGRLSASHNIHTIHVATSMKTLMD